ncbi:MAG: type II toxin-antitoxin system Phd/YefM family antitoxin [Streptosporangiaceae bacterium]
MDGRDKPGRTLKLRLCVTQGNFVDRNCTALYGYLRREVTMAVSKGAEEARNHLPELLDAAEKGRPTVITKRGRPVAVLAPIMAYSAANRQHPLTPLAGSGRGLWGPDSAQTLRDLRDEWSR